jgi:hypothetical protein
MISSLLSPLPFSLLLRTNLLSLSALSTHTRRQITQKRHSNLHPHNLSFYSSYTPLDLLKLGTSNGIPDPSLGTSEKGNDASEGGEGEKKEGEGEKYQVFLQHPQT